MLVYIEPFCGVAGDMLLGAWVDAGVDPDELRRRLMALNLPGFALDFERVNTCGITGARAKVHVHEHHHRHDHGHDQQHHHHHRRLADVKQIVEAANLSQSVTEHSVRAFERLAQAEAEVHGATPETIHFHEVGALDAVVDVVGSMICLELLAWPRVVVGPIHVGGGVVKCAHGMYPVPAPATAVLLRGKPVVNHGLRQELVTPTGAAILDVIASHHGDLPAMTLKAIGYGVGTRDNSPWPNVVRVLLGSAGPRESEPISVLETDIDDMNAELFGHLMQRLFDAGALDVSFSAVQMKRNRPGTRITVLGSLGAQDQLADVVLRETSTLGVRWHVARRYVKSRRRESVETPWGPVAVKMATWANVTSASPEFGDAQRLAQQAGVPLIRIYEAVQRACDQSPGAKDTEGPDVTHGNGHIHEE